MGVQHDYPYELIQCLTLQRSETEKTQYHQPSKPHCGGWVSLALTRPMRRVDFFISNLNPFLVIPNLPEGNLPHVGAGAALLSPVHDEAEGIVQAQGGLPAEAGASLGDVELEVVGLVGMLVGVGDPTGSPAPKFRGLFDDPAHRARILIIRPKIPAFGVGGAVLIKPFGQQEIAAQGFQYMLPGANGVGVADAGGLAAFEGGQQVGDQPVLGPVAAADDVTGPDSGD